MSISYIKDIPVVFMVQEGTDAPREATEEDFLRAGFLPAAGRGFVSATEVAPEKEVPEAKEDNSTEEDPALTSCEDCVFLGEDHFLVDLVSLPGHISDALTDLYKDRVKIFRLEDLKDGLKKDVLDPLLSFADSKISESKAKVEAEKPVTKTPVEDFAGDLFNGAFSVFNTVKDGLSGLLDPLLDPDFPETAKPAAKESEPVAPVVEEPAAEPEFNEFEQTVIDKFEEMGLGADAKSAMRKSREFSEFLVSQKPTPEQTKAFADMLKNGKPPFFG